MVKIAVFIINPLLDPPLYVQISGDAMLRGHILNCIENETWQADDIVTLIKESFWQFCKVDTLHWHFNRKYNSKLWSLNLMTVSNYTLGPVW